MTGQFKILPLILILVVIWATPGTLSAQVKIGNNPSNVNPNAILELESTNKGVLMPRVQLDSTHSPAPLSAFVKGMVVYNTRTVNDVSEGIYYCDSLKWVKIANAGPEGWSVNGNSGINSATNFLGTKDSVDLVIKANDSERMRIKAGGKIGIGTNTPATTLHINGQLTIDTVLSGNIATDSILVLSSADNRVKRVAASSLSQSVQKTELTVVSSGQINFNTPSSITDPNRVFLYRNGVMIAFTVAGSNVITAEIPCMAGDEIKIIQMN